MNDEERTRCEVWTRVMGYYRPLSHFNPGKKQEFCDRIEFEEVTALSWPDVPDKDDEP